MTIDTFALLGLPNEVISRCLPFMQDDALLSLRLTCRRTRDLVDDHVTLPLWQKHGATLLAEQTAGMPAVKKLQYYLGKARFVRAQDIKWSIRIDETLLQKATVMPLLTRLQEERVHFRLDVRESKEDLLLLRRLIPLEMPIEDICIEGEDDRQTPFSGKPVKDTLQLIRQHPTRALHRLAFRYMKVPYWLPPRIEHLDLKFTMEPLLAKVVECLPNLKTLNINYNPITIVRGEALPESLETLTMTRCMVTDIFLMEHLSNLYRIDLTGCPLGRLIFTDFSPIGLRELIVPRTELPYVRGIGHLQNLEVLDCSANELTSLEGLAALPKLRELNAAGNPDLVLANFNDLPSTLVSARLDKAAIESLAGAAELTRLKTLHLSCQKLGDLLRDGTQPLPPNLKHLRLGDTTLAGMPASAFPASLLSLDLSHCVLTDPSSLIFPAGLEELNLSFVPLRKLDQVPFPRGLLRLRVKNAELLTLSEAALPRSLLYLDASANHITAVNAVALPSRLKHLEVENNELTEVSGLNALKDLHILSLACNAFQAIEQVALPPRLVKLDLSENTVGQLALPDTLHALSLKQCFVRDHNSMQFNKNLKTLDLVECKPPAASWKALPPGVQVTSVKMEKRFF